MVVEVFGVVVNIEMVVVVVHGVEVGICECICLC